MGHYSWFTHFDLVHYDHIIGALIVFVLLFLAAKKVQSNISKPESVIPGEKLSPIRTITTPVTPIKNP